MRCAVGLNSPEFNEVVGFLGTEEIFDVDYQWVATEEMDPVIVRGTGGLNAIVETENCVV